MLPDELLHHLVNIFAGGRSSVKITGFFLYITILTVFALLGKFGSTKNYYKPLQKIMIILSTIIFCLGIFANLWITRLLRLKLTDYFVIFNHNEISSNSLAHSHILKGAAGIIASKITKMPIESADTGSAFVGLLPNYFYYAILLIFLFLVTSLILYSKPFVNKHKEKSKLLLVIFYSIVSFSLAKNTLDGGVLSKEVAVSLIALIVIANFSKIKKAVFIGLIISVQATIVAINGMSITVVFQSYSISLVYFFLLLPLIYYIKGGGKKRRLVLITTLSTLVVFYYLILSYQNNDYSRTNLTKNDIYYLTTYKDIENANIRLKDTIGDLKIYEIQNNNNTSYKEIAGSYQLIDNIEPIKTPWKDCTPTAKPIKYSFLLASLMEIDHKNVAGNSVVSNTNIKLISRFNGYYKYQISLSINECLPRHINIIHEYFKQMGLDFFIIINPKEFT